MFEKIIKFNMYSISKQVVLTQLTDDNRIVLAKFTQESCTMPATCLTAVISRLLHNTPQFQRCKKEKSLSTNKYSKHLVYLLCFSSTSM